MYGAHTESFDNATSQPNYETIMSAENKNGLAAFTHFTHTQAFWTPQHILGSYDGIQIKVSNLLNKYSQRI